MHSINSLSVEMGVGCFVCFDAAGLAREYRKCGGEPYLRVRLRNCPSINADGAINELKVR